MLSELFWRVHDLVPFRCGRIFPHLQQCNTGELVPGKRGPTHKFKRGQWAPGGGERRDHSEHTFLVRGGRGPRQVLQNARGGVIIFGAMSALMRFADSTQTWRAVRDVPLSDSCTATKQRRHSIISSARKRSEVGASRPKVFAVFRLKISSNLVGCSTGRSAGLAPLAMRST
jgi:hypothetical protein